MVSKPDVADTLEQMLIDARAELAVARRSVAKWESVVAALESANGSAATSNDAALVKVYPLPRDAILGVMKQHPNAVMKLKQVLGHVRDAGLYDPGLKAGDNAYGTALRRLALSPDRPIHQATSGGYYYQAVPETLLMFPGPHPGPGEGSEQT
ncbi:MAG: hypothetical protein ABIQ01_05865 [Pseudolysinimonas sp.]